MLQNIDLPDFLDTSNYELSRDFFIPLLKNATTYDRGVGFFSSGWLRVNSAGLVEFAANYSRARWITSPILDKKDWEAMLEGSQARSDTILRQTLERNINNLAIELEAHTLSAMAWMIADGILDFRLALPVNKLSGEFHAKFGIFTDSAGNRVSFEGSYNDSIQGLRNYESMKVFCSWKEHQAIYVKHDAERFEKLWFNKDLNVRVIELPEAAREQILKLRTYDRPYSRPSWVQSDSSGKRQLWKHQQEAIEAWEKNNRIGLINMATGSGKTTTALVAAERCPGLSLLIIAVPSNSLVEQWAAELKAHTSFPEPILVYQSSKKWQERLFTKLRAAHIASWPEAVVVIGSLASLSGNRFLSVLQDAGIPSHTLLIVDEVHNAGAPKFQKVLLPRFEWRLGLSATPERHFDEEGTAVISEYFEKTVYRYTMKQALDDGRLSPYKYYVYAAILNEQEYQEYIDITRRIIILREQSENQAVTFQTNNVLDGDSEEIRQLLFRRANILKKCTTKADIVKQVLAEHPPKRCLIYCADNEQLNDVAEVLQDVRLVYLKYTATTSPDQRQRTLETLGRGQLPVLLAIDCLDEGVDVPAVDEAIILASSTNRRQFIQRRGRILRRFPGKKLATLIDVIALPPESVGIDGKNMLKGELARAKEIAELAENRHQALLQVQRYTEKYGVLLAELLAGDNNG